MRLSVLLATLLLAPCARAQQAPGFDFKAQLLVAACDTDMVPSAYLDGKLGPPAGEDALAVIRLDRPVASLRAATVPATNAVTGPPTSVAVTPDGRFAIVVETQGPRPAGRPDAVLKQLPPGRKITVVDLADPDHPKAVQQIEAFERPVSVSVNKDGTLVAVLFAPHGKQGEPPIAIYPFAAGRLGPTRTPALPGYVPGEELTDAEWMPTRDVLGIVTMTHPRLSMVEYAGGNLRPWGEPVDLDRSSFTVKFTADGRFALVNALFFGGEVRGTVTSIRIDAGGGKNGLPVHTLVSHAETGPGPEGLAVSPDGRWVATTNLERSAFPVGDPRLQYFSTLTLLRLDPATGTLESTGEYPFDGALSEAVVFDNSSRFLAATTFSQFDDPRAGGTIDFWRIAGDYADPRRVELVKTRYSVPVPRGPQSLAIVR